MTVGPPENMPESWLVAVRLDVEAPRRHPCSNVVFHCHWFSLDEGCHGVRWGNDGHNGWAEFKTNYSTIQRIDRLQLDVATK